MLRLADTSVRVYRRKDGKASLRLRSYLMVKTNVGFRLGAYLKRISCQLTLPSGEVIEFDELAYSDAVVCKREMETMVHDFWASAVADMPTIRNQAAMLRLDYQLSFTGHDLEESSFEVVVPLVKRTTRYALSQETPSKPE